MSKKLQVHTGASNGYSPPSYWKEQNLAKIDISNEESMEKWQSALHMSRKELLDAISFFGPVVRDIRRGMLISEESEDEAA